MYEKERMRVEREEKEVLKGEPVKRELRENGRKEEMS